MTWILKSTPAAERRVNKLVEMGVNVDIENHSFRSLLGYNYLEVDTYIEEDEKVNVGPHFEPTEQVTEEN